jgi:hypothetical protein
MATTLAELQARLEALQKVRATGLRSSQYDGRSIEYRSDAEIAAAIGDLERQIAAFARRPVRTIYINSSRGI